MENEIKRIKRIKDRYCKEVPSISIERAKLYTDFIKENEYNNESPSIKVSKAMNYVFSKMTYYLDMDDKIAGSSTEYFLGVPIDVERGIFNKVLSTELSLLSMVYFKFTSVIKTIKFILTKGHLESVIKSLKNIKINGGLSLDMKLKIMSKRKINPFKIENKSKEYLLKNILPYWKTRSVVFHLEQALEKSGLYAENTHDFIKGIPGNTSSQVQMISTAATIASIQGHVILDYEKVLRIGLKGILREIEEKLIWDNSTDIIAMKIAAESVILFSKNLTYKIKSEIAVTKDVKRLMELHELLKNCENAPYHPAQNFKEAVQCLWTIKVATEISNPINLSSFGRLDQVLYPYYEKSIKDNELNDDDVIIILSELLLKMMSHNLRPETNILSPFYHRFLGSVPITIGGINEHNEDATNELTYLFIKASNLSRAVTNISIRVHPKMSDSLFYLICDSLREGNSALSFYNDSVFVPAFIKRGIISTDAKNYAIVGCVEAIIPGKTAGMSANAILLSRVLDITLRNGDSKTLLLTVKNEGIKTGNPDTFLSFSELLNSFIEQARVVISKTVKASKIRDDIYEKYLPAPFISLFVEKTLDTKKDVTSGGAQYDFTGISFINSIANVVDSLLVIKKLVYETKQYTIKDILTAVDHNFTGFEKLYQDIKNVEGKWGNGEDEADKLARFIANSLFSETFNYTNEKNKLVVPYAISMTSHTIDGKLSIASPDGRKAMTPFAASCNPYNNEKCGVTNTLKSITAIDFTNSLGCAINMKFHPKVIGQNRETQKKWVMLLKTYFEMGGAQLQPTVVSKEMLIDAQKNPDSYRDLIIKVGGYSTYFVDLGKEIQNEIINRTLHV